MYLFMFVYYVYMCICMYVFITPPHHGSCPRKRYVSNCVYLHLVIPKCVSGAYTSTPYIDIDAATHGTAHQRCGTACAHARGVCLSVSIW